MYLDRTEQWRTDPGANNLLPIHRRLRRGCDGYGGNGGRHPPRRLGERNPAEKDRKGDTPGYRKINVEKVPQTEKKWTSITTWGTPLPRPRPHAALVQEEEKFGRVHGSGYGPGPNHESFSVTLLDLPSPTGGTLLTGPIFSSGLV